MENINSIIKEYFKNNKVKFKDVSVLLNMSQSNFSERLNSKRSFTLDECSILYDHYGDEFAIKLIEHYNPGTLVLVKVNQLIKIVDELKGIEKEEGTKNDRVFDVIEQIDHMINGSSINKKSI